MTPILMYHEVVKGRPEELHAVSARQFADQMAWLSDHGYAGMSLERWWSLRRQRGVPPQTVVLTFDDGYRDNYIRALPVLLNYAYRATIFVVTDFMGKTSAWRPGKLGSAPLLSVAELLELAQVGIGIGSHTTDHRPLTSCSPSEVRQTLKRSREELRVHLGQPPFSLAYPYSDYDARTQTIVRDVGYRLACTYRPHYVGAPGSDPLALQRVGILATDTVQDFAAKVRAAPRRRLSWYWRVALQRLAQWVRRGGAVG
jgi:peptidoglycan/xylan/chitin deacetylase (PgdA/CDA1 family)